MLGQFLAHHFLHSIQERAVAVYMWPGDMFMWGQAQKQARAHLPTCASGHFPGLIENVLFLCALSVCVPGTVLGAPQQGRQCTERHFPRTTYSRDRPLWGRWCLQGPDTPRGGGAARA